MHFFGFLDKVYTDLRSTPDSERILRSIDRAQETQLIYGERFLIHEKQGSYLRVESIDQARLIQGRWIGYQGWIENRGILWGTPTGIEHTVTCWEAPIYEKRSDLTPFQVIGMGSKVYALGEDDQCFKLKNGWIHKEFVRSLDLTGKNIIKTAEQFIGTPYVWGGRSVPFLVDRMGVDCSGLSQLAYQIHGIMLPRNSGDQLAAIQKIKLSELEEGDLIFLTSPGKKSIGHVMISAGGEEIIESTETGWGVRRATFVTRLGVSRAELIGDCTQIEYKIDCGRVFDHR